MANKQGVTGSERFVFASEKVGKASKWIIFSGTATYFLTELVELLGEFELPKWLFLITYFVVNVLLYAIAKYVEGETPIE